MKSENFVCVERYYLLSKNPHIEYYRIFGKNKKHFDNLIYIKKPRLKDESTEEENEEAIKESL